ncbi:unnamed protein product [Phaedon cochleariae]|uniref:Importin N-terminal domain-containing protein n=1 Tax=Phaedon cochleariae TaxID=80249 RepID=A0A9P0D7G4_PHACE|nr:unnamed protein product [Phaedon cochleariae]
MDLRENGSLAALENLIEEFFNPMTNNNRKHEIESQLNYFKTLPCLSNYCVYFIMNTTSQYVKMFALCTLETVITQQWSNIEWSSKEEVKNTIQNCFVEQGLISPHYLRHKYSKLLIEIARHDWPGFYPNFFNNIVELLKTDGNQLIGLVLLRMTSEEFMGIQAMFKDSDRKQEIVRLLHQHIPEVLEILENILENLGSKPRHTSTATPPPSPAHPSSSPPPAVQPAAHSGTGGPFRRIDDKALAKEALQTVQHLFTWVPFQIIPRRMIEAVFGFTIVSSYSQDDDDMCVLAMSTLNELLYRKCIPPESHEFFVQLYHQIMGWLRELTSSSNRIDTMDPAFMEKLSELLILMIEHHMWRLESDPEFTMVEFLSPLFQLTMQFTVVQSYLCCLSVWAAFMKQMKQQNVKKYSEVFVGLITALLKKFQFTYNSSQLNLIDDKLLDEDNQTEWQVFFKSTVEVIAMVAEFSPHDTFSLVIAPWKICYDIFRNMEHAVDYQTQTLKFQISETEKLGYVLKDFSSLTQTLTRLASVYIDSDSENQGQLSMPIMNSLFEKILECASIINKVRFYDLKIGDSRITECFIEIHGQLLAALKTLLVRTTRKNDNIENIDPLLDLTLPLLRSRPAAPPRIAHSAAHLFLGLSDAAFAPHVVVLPQVGQFVAEAPMLRFADADTASVVCKAVSNLLLKSWGNLSQADSEQRSAMVNTFFDRLTNDFRSLSPITPEESVRTVVERTLPSLSIITENCQNLPMASKKLMAAAIRPTVQHALYLFPTFVRYKEISNHILIFFLNVMGVLQQQLGVEDTKNAVQVFLQVTMNEHQEGTMTSLDKLVQILQLVVEAPGNAWKTFLPGVLQLCMESVYPLVVSQAGNCPDVFAALLALLYRILLHRWQYFYVSQVRLGYSPGCSDSEIGPDHPQKPEQLLAILQVFGQALLQQDMNIFRLSLVALEDLNGKWKLYHKAIFRNNLLSEFLTVLIKCLLDKSQSSLSEDIQVVVYNMAAVNFDEFFSAFLVRFVQNMEGVTPQQCEILLRNFVHNHDKDLPTFVNNLQNFVKEAQHYRMCNMSSSNHDH